MSTVAVDPRIRARRRLIARGVFRRRRWVLVVLAVVAVAGAAAWAVLSTSLLGVRQVQVRGATHTGSDEILAAAGIESGTPLARLATAEIEDRIETLPWVANATVTRHWPGTVEVVVHERHAVVAVAVGGSWALTDLTGKVLSIEPGVPAMPEVRGPLPTPLRVGGFLPAQAAGAVRVAAILPASLRSQVVVVSWTGDGEVLLELARGGVAELGRADDPEAQMISLATVLAAVPPGPLEIVDLRAPAVPVVRSDDPPPPADEPVAPAFPVGGEVPVVAPTVASDSVIVPPDGSSAASDPAAPAPVDGAVAGVTAPAVSTP